LDQNRANFRAFRARRGTLSTPQIASAGFAALAALFSTETQFDLE
jgi:hypothetical protein